MVKKTLVYCTLQYIAVPVVLVLYISIHYRNDWTSGKTVYTQFLTVYVCSYVLFLYYKNLHSHNPYEMSFYQNPVTNCNIAI